MIKFLLLLICVLLSIAFITLFERKILSYAQERKGPNVVGVGGILQPFSDGIKLLTKESPSPQVGKALILSVVPVLIFFLMLVTWSPSLPPSNLQMNNTLIFILFISSLVGLLIFFTGWGGGSTYSFLGGLRASAQVISYEVILFFFLIIPLLPMSSFDFPNSGDFSSPSLSPSFFYSFSMLPLLMVAILAETNRAPFDLTEGESELVSGFNTEYSSIFFVFLFLGEYGFILFFSLLASLIWFNTEYSSIFFVFLLLWVRSCFPRKRYDLLMEEMWVVLFPLSCFSLLSFSLLLM